MHKQEKKYLLFPDTVVINCVCLIVLAILLYYEYRYDLPRASTIAKYRYRYVLGGISNGLICIFMIIWQFPLSTLWIKINPNELVWKSSFFAKPLPYPSERIIAIKIYFGVHALNDDHSRAYSKTARAVIYPTLLPTLAIFHRKRMVALCCRYRKKLFLRLVECCPNAKIEVVTKKNKPIPKRYQETLLPYLTRQETIASIDCEDNCDGVNDT